MTHNSQPSLKQKEEQTNKTNKTSKQKPDLQVAVIGTSQQLVVIVCVEELLYYILYSISFLMMTCVIFGAVYRPLTSSLMAGYGLWKIFGLSRVTFSCYIPLCPPSFLPSFFLFFILLSFFGFRVFSRQWPKKTFTANDRQGQFGSESKNTKYYFLDQIHHLFMSGGCLHRLDTAKIGILEKYVAIFVNAQHASSTVQDLLASIRNFLLFILVVKKSST